jgi:minichromosome maintenance protein 10
LYSVIRPLPDKQGFDVPVAGDFVTIAVVAERGPIKFTRAPIGVGGEEDDDRNGQCSATEKADTKQDQKMRGKWKPESAAKSSGKKYVNIKLVDFGARARSSSFATGAKAIIRGDAFLSLLLFESDSFDTATRDGGKPERVYKGGSRGAFEALSKLKEGDVIALLNPKILKPFQVCSPYLG